VFNDPQRLKTLAYLIPEARQQFEALLEHARAQGYIPSIVSAVRTCREQGGLALTKAKRSWHVFGRAVDIELHKGAPLSDPAKFYRELGEWWEQRGGTWGGRWTETYPVAPGVPGAAGDVLHFQWTPAPVGETPPLELWPRDADCEEIDKRQREYLLAHGGQAPSRDVQAGKDPPPASSSSPSGAKKKAAPAPAPSLLGLLAWRPWPQLSPGDARGEP